MILVLVLGRDLLFALRGKIRLTLFGLEVETTLPELDRVTKQNLGGELRPFQAKILNQLAASQTKSIPHKHSELSDDERGQIRALMNSGIIATDPPRSHLGEANALVLTALGRLLKKVPLDAAKDSGS